MADGMGTARKMNGFLALKKAGFQFAHETGAEDVLYSIGVPVHVVGGNIGLFDKIKFPESMVPSGSCRLTKTGFGEPDPRVIKILDVIFSTGGF